MPHPHHLGILLLIGLALAVGAYIIYRERSVLADALNLPSPAFNPAHPDFNLHPPRFQV